MRPAVKVAKIAGASRRSRLETEPRLTMAKNSVTDYYFAIGTDRKTEQHEETEEPCEFKF